MSQSVTVRPVVDRRQPWLGLTSYSETDSELFFGREQEGLELLRLVRREVLTVLFGPSGTGKTSLLNASLFPRLRESAFLPIAIRLDHSSDRPDYVGQIRALIAEALHADATRPIEEEAIAPQQVPGDQETLWEYLHRMVFWDWRNNPVTPVLVFDQFEEIFTLGRSGAATKEFLAALADLVENYIPAVVRSRMDASGGTIPFSQDQPKSKIVLSLREDFVWRLDGLRKSMPSVMHNRFAIVRMNGEQALRAVREPGRGILEDPVALQIVRFVAAANQSRAALSGVDVQLDDLQVDPALLSVVCRELNARRIEQAQDHITEDLLDQAGTNILDDFYERGFSGLHSEIRVFVEDRLLTASGFRSTVPLEEATHTGIASEDIRTLVDRRLIRVEERLGIPHVELAHDLLTRVVQKSRDERQEREQRERERQQREAEERIRVEREASQQSELRRARRQLAIVLVAAVICFLFGLWALLEQLEARRQREEANRLTAIANAANTNLETQRRVAVGETIRRGISQAQTEFQVSPVRALLLAVEALDASKSEQPICGQRTCVELAAKALVDLLSRTGGTPLSGHNESVLALSFSADGKLLATADKTAWKLWRVEQLQSPLAGRSNGTDILAMSLSEDGKFVATAAFGGAKLFWIDRPQSRPFDIRQPGAYLNNMGPTWAWFSVDSKLLLATDGVANASVWRLDQLKDPEFIAKIPDGFPVRFASFTSDEKFIVTLDSDGKVWKWQLDQLVGKVKPTPVQLGDLRGLVTAAFFSGDGQRLLIPRQLNTKGLQRAARLIDLFNWNEERPNGDALGVATQAAALSADGGLAAIADDGGSVQIWRRDSLFAVLHGHEGAVYAVSFSPDGKFIATAGNDKTARLWRVDQPFAIGHQGSLENWSTRLGELTHLAAKTAGRNFTCNEWKEFFPDKEYRVTFPELPSPQRGRCSTQANSN